MLFISLSICCRNLFFAFFFIDLLLSICKEEITSEALWSLEKTVAGKRNWVLSAICIKFRLFLPIFKSLPSFVFRPPHILHKFLITCTIYKVSSTYITSCIFKRKYPLDEKRQAFKYCIKNFVKKPKTNNKSPWSVNDHHVLVSFNEAWTTADRLEC